MKRIGALAVATMAIGLLLAGNAQAGFILASYDLAGSTITVNSPLGSDSDDITGTVTFRYWTPNTTAPLTGRPAQMVGGDTYTLVDQNFGGNIVLNGTSNQTIGGQNLVMAPGGNVLMAGPAPATQSGVLSCVGAFCGLAGFPTTGTPVPQNSNNPFFIPTMAFTSGQAGVGDWSAATLTQTAAGGATIQFKYVGQEISRDFVPEPGTASLVYLGLAGMAGASSYMRRRNR